jgi:hypothetical protein
MMKAGTKKAVMTPATAGTVQQQEHPPATAGMATADNRHQNKKSATAATAVTEGTPNNRKDAP